MNRPSYLKRYLLAFFISFLLIVGGGVTIAQARGESTVNRFNVVLVTDASGSMAKTDPNELRYDAIRQFVGLLAEEGNRLGGVVFSEVIAAETEPIYVSTQEDKSAVVDTLVSVEAGGGTNIGLALDHAVKMVKSSGDTALPSVIVLFGDGETELYSKEEEEASKELLAEAVQEARESGIAVYTICLNANGKANTQEFQQIAKATNGEFREVNDSGDLPDVFNMFYGMIYGTQVNRTDDTIPDEGVLKTPIEVPGIGVEEINVIIYGNPESVELLHPDGSDSGAIITSGKTFIMLKAVDIVPGTWTLLTKGVPGSSIAISLVYNTNLEVAVETNVDDLVLNPKDPLEIKAFLMQDGVKATDAAQYRGFEAELVLLDGYQKEIERVPMRLDGNQFSLEKELEEGVYYLRVHVSGTNVEQDSATLGPLQVSADAPASNTPPVPVKTPIETTVRFWPINFGPFKTKDYVVDLKTLAVDDHDSVLHYEIVSTSFMDDDYELSGDNVLTLKKFSMRKGAFTVRATDSQGLYCDIEIIVKMQNLGIMALLGVLALMIIAAIIFCVGLYLALTKPFRGSMMVQSYVNGNYQGGHRRELRRGRAKLSIFGLEATGLNYTKSYFQATGDNYVILVTNIPVQYAGTQTKKVRIDSGAETVVTVSEGRQLLIRFDSRMRGGRRR